MTSVSSQHPPSSPCNDTFLFPSSPPLPGHFFCLQSLSFLLLDLPHHKTTPFLEKKKRSSFLTDQLSGRWWNPSFNHSGSSSCDLNRCFFSRNRKRNPFLAVVVIPRPPTPSPNRVAVRVLSECSKHLNHLTTHLSFISVSFISVEPSGTGGGWG